MDNKTRFEKTLLSIGRPGMEAVLKHLEELGFYKAPASTKFHGSTPGGLLQHSLYVYDEAMLIREAQLKLKPDLAARLPEESIAVAALLHDVCKAEVYVEMQKWKKDKDGKWEQYNAYGVDYSRLPVGHGEKSVIRLLRCGLQLTDDELIAIRWHMTGFDLAFQSPEARSNYGAATDRCPLLAVISAADRLASHLLEA